MANVTVSPVVPFNNEDEQKSEYVHDNNALPISCTWMQLDGRANACKKPRKKMYI